MLGNQRKLSSLILRESSRMYSSRISKVLIANRGEIACRVARTAKRLGVKTVAVYSDADKNALHVSMTDEAHHIGPSPASESYLRSDKILKVAEDTGCEAIHPGYGFLSENADFAEQCGTKGITFMGPPVSAIRDMGSKSLSKKIMEAAGVPVVKGYHGEDQSDELLKAEAERIGFPVMLKAVKGGGGKGMRMVRDASEFFSQLTSARNEAMKAFGDAAMIVESYIERPRHVEVQIFGDSHGNYVYIGERDCSIQRRHQKVLEESPAPLLPDEVRIPLCDAAVKAARAVNYVGAGTVEFILDAVSLQYSFMEMNTRLQVEHPVTEMVSGLDLVEWQFRVASGERLPLTQDQIKVRGHAIEARIYAEDPNNGFLPQAGVLEHLCLPKGDHVRVDTGVRPTDQVPVFYDPMIAKLIVWGANREQALSSLSSSLADFHVSGVTTNINFLLAAARHEEFCSGRVHTGFIADHESELLQHRALGKDAVVTAVSAMLHSEAASRDTSDPFYANPGFRVNLPSVRTLNFTFQGTPLNVDVEYLNNNAYKLTYSLNGKDETLSITPEFFHSEDNELGVRNRVDGKIITSSALVTPNSVQVFSEAGLVTFELASSLCDVEELDDGAAGDQQAVSPMPGVVDQVLVATNDIVTKGQALLTVIAMKMEYTIRAPYNGTVLEILHQPGDAVSKGTTLIKLAQPPSE